MSTQGQGDVNEWTFAACLKVAQTGYGEWALNPRNDTATEHLAGTVIVSDMMVCIAEAFQRALSSSRGEQGWRTMDSAPTDGTHIIGNTQWGAREIWWHKDTYEGEYWTDEGDSEPEPTGWIPMPGPVPASLAGQVPDGYVLVPKEPTEEMIEAGNQACDMNCHLGGFEQGHVYRAMLSAAPQPTAGGDAP